MSASKRLRKIIKKNKLLRNIVRMSNGKTATADVLFIQLIQAEYWR